MTLNIKQFTSDVIPEMEEDNYYCKASQAERIADWVKTTLEFCTDIVDKGKVSVSGKHVAIFENLDLLNLDYDYKVKLLSLLEESKVNGKSVSVTADQAAYRAFSVRLSW